MDALKTLATKDSFLAFVDQAVTSGTNFGVTLLLAKRLDIKSFGLYASVLLLLYLAVSMINAFLIQPFQVMAAKMKQRKQYITALFLAILVLLCIPALVLVLLSFFSIKSGLFQISTAALICFLTGFLINDFFRKLLLGLSRIKTVLLMDVLFLIFNVLFLVLDQVNLSEVLFIIGLGNLITALPGFIFVIRNYERPVLWKSYAAAHFKEGKWLLSVAVLQWGSSNFFILTAGIYLGIEALGALRLVQTFFGILNIGLQMIENYFLPKIALLYHQNAVAAKEYLLRLTFSGAAGFGLVTLLFFIFSNPIIVMAGGLKYQHYGYVVKMMAVLYFFIFLGYPVRIAVRILMLNKIFFTGYFFSFMTSLLTFHFLLNYSGLYGAVSGLILNQIIMILYWKYQLHKKQFQLWK